MIHRLKIRKCIFFGKTGYFYDSKKTKPKINDRDLINWYLLQIMLYLVRRVTKLVCTSNY